MEFLIALLLKFWVMIWGLLTGSITSVPFFRRILLRRSLGSRFDGRQLELFTGDVPFLLRQLVVLAPDNRMRWQVVFRCADMVLSKHETRILRLPDTCHEIIVEAELIDLRKGRRAHLFRRLPREVKP